ncbi:sugar ABC transporter substrate-binding protein [Aeromicrobium sp. UC242_57]|uniref:sugar ABC transporter substrate-binding protein n=1 Tax=Aeromicrobium sp. UC242_57 TaxID=3374624 RepID=UPI003794CF42
MKRSFSQHTPRRPRSLMTGGIALVAVASMLLSACADDTSDGDVTANDGTATSASETLGVSDEGEFAGLITGSGLTEPTVDGDKVTIDVGGGQEIAVDKGKKLKVGMFVSGGATPYFQTGYAWAKAQGEAYGWTVDLVDASFDAGKQADQIQTAISTKKYDAILVNPVDGAGACDAFTKQAPAAGVLVISYENPICGKDLEPVQDSYIPGMLGAVGGSTSAVTWQAFQEQILSETPQGKGLSVVIPQSTCICTAGWNKALDEALKKYPDAQVTRVETPSPDAAGGQIVTEQYLKDNKDAQFISVISDEMGAGAVEAVKAAGLTGKVKVYVSGGNALLVDMLKDGRVAGTHPYYNGTAAQTAMLMFHEAVAGNPVPRVIANDGHALESYSDKEPPFFTYVTPEIAKSGDYVPNSIDNATAR